MKYAKLGRTGLDVSLLGLGTWAFASQSYGSVDRQEALASIRRALDAGITFFDSAPLYGTAEKDGIAEEILGQGLGAQRKNVVVSTKFGRNPKDGSRPVFTGERARTSVEESLKRLGTDYIDVLFFHSPFGSDEIHDDVWEGLADVKEQGKVRFVGHSISMFQETEGMARRWAEERKIDVIQVVLSLLNRESEPLIRDLGEGLGIGVVAREALANGFLTGAVQRDTIFPANNLNSRYTREEISERVEQTERLSFLVRPPIATLAQAALRWVMDTPGVSTVLTGAKNRAELEDCAAAASAPGFTGAERAKARELHVKDYPAA